MISFKNVNKYYNNGFHALKNINLDIQQGEFIAIIGLSGAGKSTLIRTINKMIDISDGSLKVNDVEVKELTGSNLRKFRRNIGMVFQSFNLVTRASVIRNVLSAMVPDLPFYRSIIGAFPKESKIKALEALDKVGILDKAYVRCDQLSGGQQQRVALARTLAQGASILLADEPVASLDPVTARQVMNDFKKINQELDITVLINIHHVELALEYCDRVIGIQSGAVVFDGPTNKVTKKVLKNIYGDEADIMAANDLKINVEDLSHEPVI
jgi:phosphonate transport system ATP-binding protein